MNLLIVSLPLSQDILMGKVLAVLIQALVLTAISSSIYFPLEYGIHKLGKTICFYNEMRGYRWIL
jgi:hypothetical protein